VDATTWSDGANASNIWTFDVSGTDTTITFGNGLVTFSHAVTVTGALTATLTGNADTATTATNVANADYGDIVVTLGDWAVNTDTINTDAINSGPASGDITINATGDDLWILGETNLQLGNSTNDCGDIWMRKGNQSSDPQVIMALSADAAGDFSITADTGDIDLIPAQNIYLGDGGATNYLQITAAGVLTGAGTASLDGELIAADTIDDDSIDFTDVTGADLTLTDCGAITGTTITASTGFVPDATDDAYLGTTAAQFSDLFLAEGGVINWDNGDATITQVGDVVTVAGADLKVTTPGTASTSVATIDGTQTLTNKTVGAGALILAELASVQLDPAGSADGKYSGITVTGLAGYSQAFGDLVTLDKDDSRWEAVDISAAAAATGDARGVIGIVVSAGTDGNACTVLLHGIIRADANFPALTIGAAVYASTTGDIVVAQPTTTDHVIRVVGFALTADEIYFNPSNDYITHT
jgi:hypothetical protein